MFPRPDVYSNHGMSSRKTKEEGPGRQQKGDWLPGLGSNQGLQLQRLTCYHYTTGQSLSRTISSEIVVLKGYN